MSSDASVAGPPRLLRDIYPPGYAKTITEKANRPFVTLTYAQSLDGCVAGEGGVAIALSGKESFLMTHW